MNKKSKFNPNDIERVYHFIADEVAGKGYSKDKPYWQRLLKQCQIEDMQNIVQQTIDWHLLMFSTIEK